MDREALQTLRGAVHRGDGAGVVAVLQPTVPGQVLQLAADGILLAVRQHVPGAPELAAGAVVALRERGWAGDEELAQELGAVLGQGARSRDLQPLPVDLEELSMILEGGFGHDDGVLDRRTGEVWSRSAMDYAAETDEDLPDFEDPDRWLYVGPQGSGEGFRDMEHFIASSADDRQVEQLADAIRGRSPFRRFRDRLRYWPDEEDRWYRFSDERQRGRAREWLADAGYRPVPASAPAP